MAERRGAPSERPNIDDEQQQGIELTRISPDDRPDIVRPDDVDPDAIVTVFRVPKELAGMRVDVFLAHEFHNTSRTRAKLIARVAGRTVDGRRIKPNARVRRDQYIVIWRPPWDEDQVPTELPVLYEDAHLLVVNKPPGIPVHPSARYYQNTVIKIAQGKFPSAHLVLAHRLDRETSGVLVLARTLEADRKIKKQFADRVGVHKSYQAITWGWPEQPAQRVALPLERDPSSTLRCSMRVAGEGEGMHAATQITVLRRAMRSGKRYGLLRCDLETGRQHQIRVHLQALGCPVVGDKLYGPDERLHARAFDGELTEEDVSTLELPRQALHAWRLSFTHPLTGKRLDIEAPLPQDMREFLEGLSPMEEEL